MKNMTDSVSGAVPYYVIGLSDDDAELLRKYNANEDLLEKIFIHFKKVNDHGSAVLNGLGYRRRDRTREKLKVAKLLKKITL